MNIKLVIEESYQPLHNLLKSQNRRTLLGPHGHYYPQHRLQSPGDVPSKATGRTTHAVPLPWRRWGGAGNGRVKFEDVKPEIGSFGFQSKSRRTNAQCASYFFEIPKTLLICSTHVLVIKYKNNILGATSACRKTLGFYFEIQQNHVIMSAWQTTLGNFAGHSWFMFDFQGSYISCMAGCSLFTLITLRFAVWTEEAKKETRCRKLDLLGCCCYPR